MPGLVVGATQSVIAPQTFEPFPLPQPEWQQGCGGLGTFAACRTSFSPALCCTLPAQLTAAADLCAWARVMCVVVVHC